MISVYKWRSIVETAACGHGKLHAGTLRKLCLTTQRNSWIRECKAVLHFSHSKLRSSIPTPHRFRFILCMQYQGLAQHSAASFTA